MRLRMVGLALLTLTINACMVGPNFKRPLPPHTHKYIPDPQYHKTENVPSLKAGGVSQQLHYGKQLPKDWWRLFHSRDINHLVELGIAHSPNLEAARQTLIQANEVLQAQIGSNLLPNINAQFTPQRQRFSGAGIGFGGGSSIFNLFNASLNISYVLDVFGGLRRQIEGYSAQVDFQAYELQAAYLTLTSNIVTTAVNMASFQAQIEKTIELIHIQRDSLKVLNNQFRLGGISKIDVLTQETQLQQTIATLAPLKQNLQVAQHTLSVLIGELPSNNALPKFILERLHLPRDIPMSVPSLLVRQRPDILAAEAQLHVASAQIGVATANLFPQFTLNGSYGYQNTVLSSLFSDANKVWAMSGPILQPIFNGGALLAQRRAAIAGYNAAFAQYRETVLQGFRNVADSLRAIQHDAQALSALRSAEIAARQSLTLTKAQFRLGGVSYLVLLIAEQQYQTASIARIRAQAARYADTVALFQALGGGWWCPFSMIDEKGCCRYSALKI